MKLSSASCLLLAGLLFLVVGPNRGKAGSYEVKKDFTLQPLQSELGIEVRAITFCHAFAYDKPEGAPPCESFDVQPTIGSQPAEFQRFRKTILGGYNSTVVKNDSTNALGQREWVVVNLSTNTVSDAGETVESQAVAEDCDSKGRSGAEVKVDSFANTNVITGTIKATGTNSVIKVNEFHKSFAFSVAMVEAQGSNLVKGRVKPGPVVRSITKGSSTSIGERLNDPVTFSVRDLATGTVTRGSLFRFTMETLPGADGDVFWESNVVRVGVSDFSFRLDLPGPYTTQTGHFQLEVRQGVVLKAESSGRYAGMLPALGTAVPFQFALDNGQDFAYDLSSIAGTNVDVTIDLSTAGEVYEEFAGRGAPPMAITVPPGAATAMLSWPTSSVPWQLQGALSINPLEPWIDLPFRVETIEGRQIARVPTDAPALFFRLQAEETPCELTISAQPLDAVGVPESFVTWAVGAIGAPEPTSFQWERLDEEGVFLDIPDGVGATFTWLVTPADRNAQFRCRVNNCCTTVTSLPAKLVPMGIAD